MKSSIETLFLEAQAQNELYSSAKWAKFIGVVYLIVACIILTITILLLTNLDAIATQLMNINFMSSASIEFLLGAGKWVFGFLMFISFSTCFINGFFLLKFGSSFNQFYTTQDESLLESSFLYLKNYFILTTILSLLSTLFSILAILVYMLS